VDRVRFLNEWIIHYVDVDPAYSSQDTNARMPLAAA
jgi:type VI secretion system protein ImpC